MVKRLARLWRVFWNSMGGHVMLCHECGEPTKMISTSEIWDRYNCKDMTAAEIAGKVMVETTPILRCPRCKAEYCILIRDNYKSRMERCK